MTTTSLAHLEQLARSATPGPWRVTSEWKTEHSGVNVVWGSDVPAQVVCECDEHDGGYNPDTRRNVEYIAAASPDVILQLLADRRELVEALSRALRLADNIGSVIDGSKTERIHKELRELEALAAKHEEKP